MIEVRPANPPDAAAVAEFQVLMARETEGMHLNPPTVARGVQAVFDDPAKGAYYVAHDRGRVVGCLLITHEWSDWRGGTIWWIQSVYVIPEARRRGVFAALYAHVRTLVADDPALLGLRLYVDKRNARAQKVYEALGMNGEHYQVFEWMKA
jgi:GNAT superfamily N-acetyltransferase